MPSFARLSRSSWCIQVSVTPLASAASTGNVAWSSQIGVTPIATQPVAVALLTELQIRRGTSGRWSLLSLPRPGLTWTVPTRGMKPGAYEIRARFYSVTERGNWSAALTFTKS